jgi:hypothetical protein
MHVLYTVVSVKTRTSQMFCHGYRKAPPGKTNTVTAIIHSELAGCKIDIRNPFATICKKYESSARDVARVTVSIIYQHDGASGPETAPREQIYMVYGR